ncbi:hypothetical protein ACK6E9_005106, partial [Escherichia coli]
MRGRSGPDEGFPKSGRISALAGRQGRLRACTRYCNREALHWAVTTGGFNSETVQDVMLGA